MASRQSIRMIAYLKQKRLFLTSILILLLVGFLMFQTNIKQKIAPNLVPYDMPATITYTTEHADEIYADEILRFAVVSDPHVGQNWHGREGGNSARLRRAIEAAKEHDAEFFVALGDLTQTGSKAEFEEIKNILDAGKLRYFTAPGNHDVFQSQTFYDTFFGPKFKMVSYTLQKKPTQFYAPVNPEAKLFFLDMTRMQSEYGDVLGKDQVLWLKTQMAENMNRTDTVVLVFSGQGLRPLDNDNEDQLALFLCESHIVAYIHGGPHGFSAQEESCYFDWMYKRDKRISTIHTISPGTIGEYSPERSAQLAIIHVFPDYRYEIERIPIGYNPLYPDYLETE